MTRPIFPLFNSHLDLAHSYWMKTVHHGDTVIDATCGNGHDTLLLAQLALNAEKGALYALDIQEDAIRNTKELLEVDLPPHYQKRVHILQQCHSEFPKEILPESVKLIVYNLGYLPGGDKNVTTRLQTTVQSLEAAMALLTHKGCISVTAYPGHPEGAVEEQELIKLFEKLDKATWSCCHHCWLNRKETAPSLFLLQKA
ncbi:MAG: class I SAM-dependent methyltransferase [Chlamydiales bacterium]|nr:class I SAM-dependent methyltransferase [Chlamydiales bacterium]